MSRCKNTPEHLPNHLNFLNLTTLLSTAKVRRNFIFAIKYNNSNDILIILK